MDASVGIIDRPGISLSVAVKERRTTAQEADFCFFFKKGTDFNCLQSELTGRREEEEVKRVEKERKKTKQKKNWGRREGFSYSNLALFPASSVFLLPTPGNS